MRIRNQNKIKKEIIIRNIREYNDNNINMESKPLKMKINQKLTNQHKMRIKMKNNIITRINIQIQIQLQNKKIE